jgi:hypothetical protein
MSEIDTQNAIRIAVSATQRAVALRNNTGLFLTLDGSRKVQAGLGKGTSDLIGLVEHVVRPEDVGRKVGLFLAIEVKTSTGRGSDEQKLFLKSVVRRGGIGGIARSAAEAESLVTKLWDSEFIWKLDGPEKTSAS